MSHSARQPAVIDKPLPGTVIDRYELMLELASGGMARVYAARSVGLGGFERVVALKVCHAHLRDDDYFVSMFVDEARLAGSIHHPNVVATLDVGQEPLLYLVMEYIDGERFGTLIKSARATGRHIPQGVALRVMIDTLLGLHAAHELTDASGAPLHIVHRDVSPQNILVGHDGVTRLVDFGVAKAEARATITRTGELKGKLGYMPPEQLRGDEVTRQADLYSAGVVLWEALTSRRLHDTESDAATVGAVLRGVVRSPSEVNPAVPASLAAVVQRALAGDLSVRYATALEFARALESCGVPVATPAQVAAHLEQICGATLAQRRERLRSYALEHPVEGPLPRRSVLAPPNGAPAAPRAAPASAPSYPSGTAPSFELPTNRSATPRWARLLGAGAAGVLVLALALQGLRSLLVPQGPAAAPTAVTAASSVPLASVASAAASSAAPTVAPTSAASALANDAPSALPSALASATARATSAPRPRAPANGARAPRPPRPSATDFRPSSI